LNLFQLNLVNRENQIQELLAKNYTREQAVNRVNYSDQLTSHYTYSKLIKTLIQKPKNFFTPKESKIIKIFLI
jgi:hypothetical protein